MMPSSDLRVISLILYVQGNVFLCIKLFLSSLSTWMLFLQGKKHSRMIFAISELLENFQIMDSVGFTTIDLSIRYGNTQYL